MQTKEQKRISGQKRKNMLEVKKTVGTNICKICKNVQKQQTPPKHIVWGASFLKTHNSDTVFSLSAREIPPRYIVGAPLRRHSVLLSFPLVPTDWALHPLKPSDSFWTHRVILLYLNNPIEYNYKEFETLKPDTRKKSYIRPQPPTLI